MVRLGRGYPVTRVNRRKKPATIPPVTFDAAGANASPSSPSGTQSNVVTAGTTTNSKTWNHTNAGNRLLVGLTMWDITYTDPSPSTHTRTVTFDGVAMSSLGAAYYSAYGLIEWFDLANPAIGTKVVSVSVSETSGAGTQPWAILCDSLSYFGVGSVTAGTAQFSASGTPSATVASAANGRTAAMLSCSVNNPTGYNQTPRSSILSAAHYAGVVSHSMIGDSAGAASVTHSESATGNVVLSQAVSLIP